MKNHYAQSSSLPWAKSPTVRLSHHCTSGSRIQRFVKLWRYFLVVVKQRFIPSLYQSFQRNGGHQDRALSHRPATLPRPAPGISLAWRYSQPDQVLSFPIRFFPIMQDAVSEPGTQPAVVSVRPFRNLPSQPFGRFLRAPVPGTIPCGSHLQPTCGLSKIPIISCLTGFT